VSALRIGLVLVLAVAAAVVANLVLLGVATGPNDPVGKLSPRAGLILLSATTTPAAPARPTPPTTTPGDDGKIGRRGQDD
jgi:hypothetical protein